MQDKDHLDVWRCPECDRIETAEHYAMLELVRADKQPCPGRVDEYGKHTACSKLMSEYQRSKL